MNDQRIWPIALGAALVLHAAILPVVVPLSRAKTPVLAMPDAPTSGETDSSTLEAVTSVAAIALISEADLGEIAASRAAPFDFSSTDPMAAHPMPMADDDRAGTMAARAANDDRGGAMRDTLRRDAEDLRAEIWNDSRRAQVATEGRGRRAESPEAVTRSEKRGFDGATDDRARARVADADPRPGAKDATGEADADGTAVPPRDWQDADPLFDSMRASKRQKGRFGRNSAQSKTTIADRGTAAADVPRRGRLVDALDSSARSDALDPAPFEMASAAAGGSAAGAKGNSRSPGVAPNGAGRGTGSRKSSVSRGRGSESVHASRTDPYFRRLYAAVDRHVKFPRDLARRLEQGVVVVRFRLNPDGRISAIKLAKSSGFRGFDSAFVSALKRTKPLGKVPESVIGGAQSVLVTAPYKFANPLIR